MRYDGIIELEGMEFHAYHGCLEKERREGNTFLVDFHAETEFKDFLFIKIRVSKMNPPVNGPCAWSRVTVTYGDPIWRF